MAAHTKRLLIAAAFALAAAPLAAAASTTHKVSFSLYVGHPSTDKPDEGVVLLLPGTVIIPSEQRQMISASRIVRELKGSYRLSSIDQAAYEVLDVEVGKPVKVPTAGAGLDTTLTLRNLQADRATVELSLAEGGKVISAPRVVTTRGQTATVGGRDGAAAPYFFMLVSVWTEEDEAVAERQKGLTPPKLVEKVTPTYPEDARKARVQGLVIIRGTVGTDGRMTGLTVVESDARELEPAALDAVSKWRFEPARDAQRKAIEFLYTVTVSFMLNC